MIVMTTCRIGSLIDMDNVFILGPDDRNMADGYAGILNRETDGCFEAKVLLPARDTSYIVVANYESHIDREVVIGVLRALYDRLKESGRLGNLDV